MPDRPNWIGEAFRGIGRSIRDEFRDDIINPIRSIRQDAPQDSGARTLIRSLSLGLLGTDLLGTRTGEDPYVAAASRALAGRDFSGPRGGVSSPGPAPNQPQWMHYTGPRSPVSNWESGTNYSDPVLNALGRDVAEQQAVERSRTYPGYGVLQSAGNPQRTYMTPQQAFSHYNLGGGGTGGIGAASAQAGYAMGGGGGASGGSGTGGAGSASGGSGGGGAGGAPWWSPVHVRTGTRIK